MILAAAVKFHMEATGEDVVLCGARHGDIFKQLRMMGFAPRQGYEEVAQGFIDNKNNFLDRKQAYLHAKACGQLPARIVHDREMNSSSDWELFSEDLW